MVGFKIVYFWALTFPCYHYLNQQDFKYFECLYVFLLEISLKILIFLRIVAILELLCRYQEKSLMMSFLNTFNFLCFVYPNILKLTCFSKFMPLQIYYLTHPMMMPHYSYLRHYDSPSYA